ncbi:MAG: flagellar biosynthesis protein FlhB [Pseudomonadota bacterium]
MSETGQEKTEQPTPKRLADARRKGQIPRSRELTAAGVTIIAAMALWILGPGITAGLSDVMTETLTPERAVLFDSQRLLPVFAAALKRALVGLAPFLILVAVVAVCAPALLGGWAFSLQALAPKLDKLNPIKGLKRVFGPNGLMELGKALAKFGLVGAVAVAMLRVLSDDLMALSGQPLPTSLAESAHLILLALLVVSAPLLIIAAVDAPFQLFQHNKQLRMTRQEVKDESKETDGNPEVKGRVRALQQEQANRRMMDEVPKADVVITNPTHYAVALRYDPATMSAPRVVAKGTDELAARIRERAGEHGIPMMRAPPLARAIYKTTRLNDDIPVRLYNAVAQVLTWVFQLRRADELGALRPEPPEIDFTEND